jgi:hypothetical protein
MAEHLLTIEDTFEIPGRGLVIVPGPLVSDYTGPKRQHVTLKFPNGDAKRTLLMLDHAFQTPPATERRWHCRLGDVAKSDVPVGTEVWTIDS